MKYRKSHFQLQYISVDCATAILNNGDIGFCYCNTCAENEGHCDSHDECQDGLACGSNNCPESLGFSSDVNCCTGSGCKPQRIILM